MRKLYKKNKLMFLTVVFFIILVMNGNASALPSTISVDAENGDFTTIQAAINNADPGDTILVYPGTYTESVNANVENISIRSFSGNPEDTIVKRLNTVSHTFKITANNVTISGFNITGAGATGIYMSGISGANIINNKLSEVGCGVQIESSSRCNFINNTVADSAQYGFYLVSSSNNCVLANNTILNTGYEGIMLDRLSDCVLANNSVSYPGSYGIRLSASNYCTLVNNSVSYADFDGIYLDSSSYCNLENNIVSNIEYSSIHLNSSGYCTLTENTVSNAYEKGIFLHNSGNCNLNNNSISNTYSDGIYLSYSGSSDLIGNTVFDGYSSGISLYESGDCILTSNMVSNTDSNGIYLYESSDSTLISNTVTNTSGGICLISSYDCTLQNNTASSGRYGISLKDIENCTVTGNIMSGNWYNFDLDIYDPDNTTGNIIDTSNFVDGKPVYYFEREPDPVIGSDAGVVYCINCGKARIENLVLQNNTYGVFLYNTSSEMKNNTINSTVYGVMVLSSQDVRISCSRFENSLIGVILEEAGNTALADNTVLNSIFGTVTTGSRDCMFENNSIRNSIYGILTLGSENCMLKGNSVRDSAGNYGLFTSENLKLIRSEENLLENSLINENTFINSNLLRSEAPYGYGIYSVSSSNLRLEGNIIDRAGLEGIYLTGCQDVELVSNLVKDAGYHGIYVAGSSGVDILDNTVQNITGEYILFAAESVPLFNSPLVSKSSISMSSGICLGYIEDLRLEGNTVKDSYQAWGITLFEPVNATLKNNTLKSCQIGLITALGENCTINSCSVTNCTSGGILIENFLENPGEYTVTGCTVEGSEIGLLLVGECILSGNTLSGNSYGIVLYDVNNSLICGNILDKNSLAGLAIDLEETEIMSRILLVRSMENPESGNNLIYNNYFNNFNNTLINSEASNIWNISKTSGRSIAGGPYLGGNYWAKPDGTGFSENCIDADKDGIADSSFEIMNGTSDYLPLTIIPAPTTRHKSSSTNYVPSGGSSGVMGIDSLQKRVVTGTRTTFNFNNPASSILGLSFISQQYSGNVIVRIEVLDGASGEKPEGEIYQLMNILVGDQRFESESNIKAASINFRVSKSWVEENNIDVSTIKINRFHNKKWNPLITEMTSEDEEYYYFTAETPGFSRYAITGDKLGTSVITPAEGKEPIDTTGAEQANNEKSTPGFESSFAVLGVLASVLFAKRRILKT